MNPDFVNKYLPFREQDSKKTVLLLLFSILPFTVLLPHPHICAAVWSASLFALGVRGGGTSPLLKRGSLSFLLFIALSASGVVLATARRETLLALLLRLSFFLPALFEREKRELCRVLSFLGGALGLFTLLSLLLFGGSTAYSDQSIFPSLSRASGLFKNPNVAAAFLLPCALFALGEALFGERGRWLHALCALLSSLGIAATYSRGALLALMACALWLFIRRFGSFRVFTTLLSLLPLLLLLTPASLLSRISSITSPDTSITYRFSLWRSICRMDRRLLLFGVGEGKGAMMGALEGVLASGLLEIEHTHSLFFHLLLSTGLLGLLLFLFLLARALLGKAPLPARAALLSLLIFGIFDDPLYYGQTEALFWLTLGLCL